MSTARRAWDKLGDRIGWSAPKPDFICIGAQKAGTQWLYDQLQFHSDFWMPPVKELHYFDRGYRKAVRAAQTLQSAAKRDLRALNELRAQSDNRPIDRRDIAFCARVAHRPAGPDMDHYASLFREKGRLISGDITPAYSTFSMRRSKQIAKRFPELVTVFLVRDPIERFWSQVGMHVNVGRLKQPTEEAHIAELAARKVFAQRSFPSETVTRWREAFGTSRFGLFFFDDLRTDPDGTRSRIISFLGGDPSKPSGNLPSDFNRKSSGQKIEMTASVRRALLALFGDELVKCAAILGGSAEEWPRKYGL